jgi:hypothetical protein
MRRLIVRSLPLQLVFPVEPISFLLRLLRFRSTSMYFINFWFRFWSFQKFTKKFQSLLKWFKILKFQTCRWRNLKKSISHLPSLQPWTDWENARNHSHQGQLHVVFSKWNLMTKYCISVSRLGQDGMVSLMVSLIVNGIRLRLPVVKAIKGCSRLLELIYHLNQSKRPVKVAEKHICYSILYNVINFCRNLHIFVSKW